MAGHSSKELVRRLFRSDDLWRVPFIPWVCSFAARLQQIQTAAMLSDAGLLSRSLLDAQRLFNYDAIINVFEPTLEAEACGCRIDWRQDDGLPEVVSHPLAEGAAAADLDIANLETRGRLPAVLEATKRLVAIRGKEVAILGVITGPISLAKHLRGDALLTELNQGSQEASSVIALAGNVGLKLCRTYCELGVDAVVVAEGMLGQIQPNLYHVVAPSLRSIWNVARFYDVHSLILSKGCDREHVEPILGLQADGVALAGNLDDTQVRDAALKRNCFYARSIPSAALLGTIPQVRSATLECLSAGSGAYFLSTEWEVPSATNVENFHEVMRVLEGHRNS